MSLFLISYLLCIILTIFSYTIGENKLSNKFDDSIQLKNPSLFLNTLNLDELEIICEQFPGLTACQPKNEIKKRKSAYMRFGRSMNSQVNDDQIDMFEKRKNAFLKFLPIDETGLGNEKYNLKFHSQSPYMKFNKQQINDDYFDNLKNNIEKRKSAYMRFGKRLAEKLNNNIMNSIEMEKRKSAYMRFGKRSLLANNNNHNFNEIEKRKSAYMRFGRR